MQGNISTQSVSAEVHDAGVVATLLAWREASISAKQVIGFYTNEIFFSVTGVIKDRLGHKIHARKYWNLRIINGNKRKAEQRKS